MVGALALVVVGAPGIAAAGEGSAPGPAPVRAPGPGAPPLPAAVGAQTPEATVIWEADPPDSARLARVRALIARLPRGRTTGGPLRGDTRREHDDARRATEDALRVLIVGTRAVTDAQGRVVATRLALDDLVDDQERTARERDRVEARMGDEAVQLYMHGTDPGRAFATVQAVFDADNPVAADRVVRYADKAFDTDLDRRDDLVDHLEELRREISRTREALAREEERLAQAENDRDQAMIAFALAVRAGEELRRTDVVFPVFGPYNFIDSLGFARPEGRKHHGADVFAPAGTPVVAVESGVLAKVGWQGLGGWRLWLAGDSGAGYYYAHLSAYAPGIRSGVRVEPGDLIGWVGDSGNARGGQPHVHFEVHAGGTDGGAATVLNPYAFLRWALDPDAPALGSVDTPLEPDPVPDTTTPPAATLPAPPSAAPTTTSPATTAAAAADPGASTDP